MTLPSFDIETCWPPELRLVVAAATSGWDDRSRESMHAGAAAGVDWQRIPAIAHTHALLPLVYSGLAGCSAVPPAINLALRGAYEANAHNSLLLTSELLRVTHALRQADVFAVAYKGPAAAQRFYGNLALRSFSDLDLLIEPAAHERAVSVLADCGYARYRSVRDWRRQQLGDCEEEFVHPDHQTTVDLHWDIAQPYLSIGPLPSGWQARARNLPLGHSEVTVFAPADEALVLTIHGGKHRWQRLGWLVDFARSTALEDLDWEALLRSAAQMRIRYHLLLAAALAHLCLRAAVPPAVLAAAKAANVPWTYAEATARSYADESGPHASRLRRWGFNLGMRERWIDRARAAFRFTFRPDNADLAENPLPTYGAFLYPVVRASRVAARTVKAIAGDDGAASEKRDRR